MAGTEVLRRGDLARAPGSCDHDRARCSGELHQEAADPSRRRQHQHRRARAELGRVDESDRGATVGEERHRIRQRDSSRHLDDCVGADDHALGVATRASRGRDDLVAEQRSSTPAPVSTIVPPTPLPSTAGRSGSIAGFGGRPARTWVSTKVTLASSTATTT